MPETHDHGDILAGSWVAQAKERSPQRQIIRLRR
jgi:hypothetical protein